MEEQDQVNERQLIHGMTRIRGHCLFSWTETVGPNPTRNYAITPDHCEACERELRGLYPSATFTPPPADPAGRSSP